MRAQGFKVGADAFGRSDRDVAVDDFEARRVVGNETVFRHGRLKAGERRRHGLARRTGRSGHGRARYHQ